MKSWNENSPKHSAGQDRMDLTINLSLEVNIGASLIVGRL